MGWSTVFASNRDSQGPTAGHGQGGLGSPGADFPSPTPVHRQGQKGEEPSCLHSVLKARSARRPLAAPEAPFPQSGPAKGEGPRGPEEGPFQTHGSGSTRSCVNCEQLKGLCSGCSLHLPSSTCAASTKRCRPHAGPGAPWAPLRANQTVPCPPGAHPLLSPRWSDRSAPGTAAGAQAWRLGVAHKGMVPELTLEEKLAGKRGKGLGWTHR